MSRIRRSLRRNNKIRNILIKFIIVIIVVVIVFIIGVWVGIVGTTYKYEKQINAVYNTNANVLALESKKR